MDIRKRFPGIRIRIANCPNCNHPVNFSILNEVELAKVVIAPCEDCGAEKTDPKLCDHCVRKDIKILARKIIELHRPNLFRDGL